MALLNNNLPATAKKSRIHVEDPLAIDKLYHVLLDKLRKHNASGYDCIILLCIGTDRSTGDCLGPLVGNILSHEPQEFIHVFGTLDKPVHAANLQETIDHINQLYRAPFIIALDACLGGIENIGCITVGDGSLQPGAGVNKNLPKVGNMHVTGIVNVGGFMEYLVLQNTRLNLVMKMATTIASAIKLITRTHIVEEAL
ncbi:spore protease YyaC [Desulfotruncus alcoholivorax]|uniref:spore protease YyaC n=1 Tax=Desulfotruncus alcoholivorax TaxID=265477 RepID=UPI0004214A9B|nr:spore protease YyaC [Desulfotruncus alcoholivorax]